MQILPVSILHGTCLEVGSLVRKEKKPVRIKIFESIHFFKWLYMRGGNDNSGIANLWFKGLNTFKWKPI
jgi:hypothetical protein